MDRCSCHQKVRSRRSRRRFAESLSTNDMKGAPCSFMSLHFSLFFETYYWHQKGRPVLSVSAASLRNLHAMTPTSGKTTCSQYLWYDALATKLCSYLGTEITRRYAAYTFECCNSTYTSWSWNRPHKYRVVTICGYGLVTLDEFGVVTLRENVPGIFMLPRAGGYQLVHGPRSKRS